MDRRNFLIQSGAAVAGGILAGCAGVGGLVTSKPPSGVAIICDPADAVVSAPPVKWAVDQLRLALVERGFVVRVCARMDEAATGDFCVVVAGRASPIARDLGVLVPIEPESLVIAPGRLGAREVLLAGGGGARGLVYALTEIADAVTLAATPSLALRPAQVVQERPANQVRSVMRLFTSDVEDKAWFNNRDFWRRYLSFLVAQRFNRFNLALGLGYDAPSGLRDTYFYFAYPFLVSVPGYEVRATNLPDAERDRNLEMLRFISDEAAARGMDFQLGLWTHAYQWNNSPNANHVIEGLTPQTQAPYSRDALAILLKECPNITGVTLRIHGESGVPEGSYDLWRTIFSGCVRSGRSVGLDLHAKGMDQPTIDAAATTRLPLTISPKFWAEHMGLPYHQAAIRPTELPKKEKNTSIFFQSEGARSFLRYGYGDLLREDRNYSIVHRLWPGTQRLLLWGDPAFAAAFSRSSSFAGTQGCEVFDPLSFKGRKGSGLPGGRDAYADASLRAAGDDFEKYRYTHRLWGRLLYNPDAAPETWQRQLRADYGAAAGVTETALGHASRILPLLTTAHLPSAANNNFAPEMYVNMSVVDDSHPQPYTDTPSPKRFGAVSPLDPQLFSRIDDHAGEMLKGQVSGKYSPVEVAQWMEDLAQAAEEKSAQAARMMDRQSPAFRRFAIDVKVQANLGRFYAQKLRAGVLYALFERTGERAILDAAVRSYRSARQAWAQVIDVTKGVYVADVTFGEGWFQRGNWSDRIAAIDRDISALQLKGSGPPQPAVSALPREKVAALIASTLGRPSRPGTQGLAHVPPNSFRRGRAVPLELNFAAASAGISTVQLYYRHTHQADPWHAVPMRPGASGYQGEIPGEFTDRYYPLQYYFEVSRADGQSWLYPGLGPDLTQQPYFVVRSV